MCSECAKIHPTKKLLSQVDCANGVGAMSLRALAPLISDYLDITICNDGSTGKLNENCGADFVKVHLERILSNLLKSHGTITLIKII